MSVASCGEKLQTFFRPNILFHSTCSIYLVQKWWEVLWADCVKKGSTKDTLAFHYFLLWGMLWAVCALLKVSVLLWRAEMLSCGAPVGYDHRSLRQKLGGIPFLSPFISHQLFRSFLVCSADTAPMPVTALVITPSSEVLLEEFQKREKVPHLFG